MNIESMIYVLNKMIEGETNAIWSTPDSEYRSYCEGKRDAIRIVLSILEGMK